MNSESKTTWSLTGESAIGCNCAWGCPCQFNALPTHGRCEALAGWQIQHGTFGETGLDGVRFASIYWWPGPVHEGNGTRQLIVDEQTTPEQREALEVLNSGQHGGAYFEIFSSVCPNVLETAVAPIRFESDRERRRAHLQIPNIGELQSEPIKNPVTGDEHRARIVLPNGFEYKEAEIASCATLRVQSQAPLVFDHTGTHSHLNKFEWSNA